MCFVRFQMVQQYRQSHSLEEIPFYLIRVIGFPYDRQPVKSCPCLPYEYIDAFFSRGDIATVVYERVN